ncbi:SAM-dependent methyltransferase [Rhodovulum sulfidophilum]|uniref:RsmB/NOP family class I SAM-dependent RNA methyltransferase n=1 Tax=Rhodovulum visakhapatnamense TaxID=364297 RepID=A0ABS1RHL2_9RHOB|nr:RsmB/NOP family class I SAM-dependent RNA methyltransferase [Rhodovulum visakhapatnamense]MBL3578176.1 RsmB/NOP family class I SAM-dependent RNA methyltransferase [Rhodovulum visakhapatnamense]OLS44799.1 SAM-dependent methyltransferase [Rhodovulum sulfidophilum]
MTPAARIAAAAELLDAWREGAPAEKLLTTWARQNRFAGSKDRAAIRDHVFDAIRCARSFAALGGAATGRGMMLGALRAEGTDPGTVFTGEGHAPAPLSEAERAPMPGLADLPEAVACDCPEALEEMLRDSLGPAFRPVMDLLRHRAPVFLRVNLRRSGRDEAAAQLAGEGIETRPHALSPTALEVTAGARRVQQSRAFADGVVELQDAASQAVADLMPLDAGARVLDLCAGGGGKTLAMAARGTARHYAHDAAPQRMRDLPDRAARAGIAVTCLDGADLGEAAPFDLVLCDVPCSGSGAWRRSPEAKWRTTPDDLARLTALQAGILDRAAALVAPGGHLGYATCSLLSAENDAQVARFLANTPGWTEVAERRLTPLDGGDGFYAAVLRRGDG